MALNRRSWLQCWRSELLICCLAQQAGENDEIASGQPSWEGGRGSPVPLPAPGSKGKRIPRRSSLSNMAGLSSPVADDGVASLPPVAPLSAGRAAGLPAEPVQVHSFSD